MNKRRLHKELKSSGASEQEATDLANIAESFKGIKSKGLSDNAKQQILSNITQEPKTANNFKWTFTGGALVAACFVVVATAQIISNTPASKPVDFSNEKPNTSEQLDATEDDLIQQMEDIESLKKEEAPIEVIEESERKYEDAVKDFWLRNQEDTEKEDNYWDWWDKRREERKGKKEDSKWQRYNYLDRNQERS